MKALSDMTFLRSIFLMLALALPQSVLASAALPRLDCGAAQAGMNAPYCAADPGLVRVQQGPGQGQGQGQGVNGGGDGDPQDGFRPNRGGRNSDTVRAPDGSPEYVVLVNAGQAVEAAGSLQAAGATFLRQRNLPQLGQIMLFFALPRNLDLVTARGLLAGVAPSAVIDLHHIYRRSSGPRIYHAAMLGDDPGRACRLGRAVRVGLIDGPVNPGHPALRGVPVTRRDVLAQAESPGSAGHGTAVAGLIGGSAGAGPFSGLAPGARLYAAEAFAGGRGGDGARLENVAAGLDWLVGQGVRLINMSFAGAGNQGFERILRLAAARGAVMVVAAGNDRSNAAVYPAASPHTIAVTAVDAAGRLYRQANYGRHIEFAAPGVDLYVAWGEGGTYRSGTSFAAPVVTALLARQAARGGVSLDGARSFLRARARDLGPDGRDERFGYGLVQSGGC